MNTIHDPTLERLPSAKFKMFARIVRLALPLVAACAAAVALNSPGAFAQAYPTRSIKLLVGYPPGGQSDIQARQTATLIEKALKAAVIVENRPGAGTLIATRALMESEPDGHTLLFTNATVGAMPFLIKDAAGFDPTTSIAPVFGIIESAGVVVVHPSVPASNLKEFIEYAKTQPGKLNYGSLGRSITMIATENFMRLAGIKVQEIPYPGAAQQFAAFLSGDIQMIVTGLTAAAKQVADGKAKPLAVLYDKRVSELPDVPTAAEQGMPSFILGGTQGVFAPARTPPAVLATIEKAVLDHAKADPEMKPMFEKIAGSYFAPITAAQYRANLSSETRLWTETARAAGIKPE